MAGNAVIAAISAADQRLALIMLAAGLVAAWLWLRHADRRVDPVEAQRRLWAAQALLSSDPVAPRALRSTDPSPTPRKQASA